MNIENEFIEVIDKLYRIISEQSIIDWNNGIDNTIEYANIKSTDGNVKALKPKYMYVNSKSKSCFNTYITTEGKERYKYTLHFHYLANDKMPVYVSRLEQIYSDKEQRVIYSKLHSDIYEAVNKLESIRTILNYDNNANDISC